MFQRNHFPWVFSHGRGVIEWTKDTGGCVCVVSASVRPRGARGSKQKSAPCSGSRAALPLFARGRFEPSSDRCTGHVVSESAGLPRCHRHRPPHSSCRHDPSHPLRPDTQHDMAGRTAGIPALLGTVLPLFAPCSPCQGHAILLRLPTTLEGRGLRPPRPTVAEPQQRAGCAQKLPREVLLSHLQALPV